MTSQTERDKQYQAWLLTVQNHPLWDRPHTAARGGFQAGWQARAALNGGAVSGDVDPPCTDCDDTGITKQTERYCSCSVGISLRTQQPAPRDAGPTYADGLRKAAQDCRYYFKHQNYTGERSEYEQGVEDTCDNLSDIIEKRADAFLATQEPRG